MFWATVYQGKSAYSWKTTARSQPGSVISPPPTRSSPRVGRSKPARRLSSVVLPHPLGPMMEKNSLFSTWKLTSCSARTGSPLIETCTLLTSLTLTCAISHEWPGTRSLPEKPGQSDEKGPAARRRPRAGREAYSLYVERAAEGANAADGPLSSLQPERFSDRRLDRAHSARVPPRSRHTQ